MEHLENDMDDLFQKAGELYPLKTAGSDWDAVAGKLQNEAPGEVQDLTGPTTVRTRNRRKWLLLLLLIPLGLGINYYSGQNNSGHPTASIPKSSPTKGDQKGNNQNKINSAIPDNSAASVKHSDNIKTTQTNKTQIQADEKTVADNGVGNLKQPENKGETITTSGRKSLALNSVHNSQNQKYGTAAVANSQTQKFIAADNTDAQKTKVPASDKTKQGLNFSDVTNTSKEPRVAVAGESTENHPATADAATKTPAVLVPATAAAQAAQAAQATQSETAVVKNKMEKTEPAKKVSQDSARAKKKINTAAKQSKGFYVGFFAGPDFSTVKFQDVHQVGSGFGLSVGYRFNKLAVETGLIWDQKYYYSSGEYFKNSPQVYYPPNTTFNGHCDMFEIPLLVRYDFSQDNKNGFFAKAGFSSYLMTHQYYSKKVNGVDSGSWPWTESANYIFSIVQLSGGYEFSIGSKTKIQIEPYIKIPLRGLGEGNMPISSAGIYFGITHSFR
jgi:hypothetical protein